MAANFRVYYPVHSVNIGGYCTGSGIPVHGAQSVNTTTTFNLTPVFELGQLDLYDLSENLPSVEMTIEKFFDGYPLIYHMASIGSTATTLVNRTNQRADVFLSIFSDAGLSASGVPLTQVYCSGMYVNGLTYTIPTQGFVSESVQLVGNDKIWKTSNFPLIGYFNDLDTPVTSGVLRRDSIIFGAAPTGSVLPKLISGMTTNNGSGYNIQTAGQFGAHVQTVTIQTSLSRQDLYELGRLRPYYRFANFPVLVNCSIEISAGGATPGDLVNASGDGNNLTNEPILIRLTDGSTFDLGNKNKLQSVTYSGGNTGGGIVTQTYSFQNYNKLDVKATSDPVGLT